MRELPRDRRARADFLLQVRSDIEAAPDSAREEPAVPLKSGKARPPIAVNGQARGHLGIFQEAVDMIGVGVAEDHEIEPLCRAPAERSEERRVGKAWVSTCRYRWSPKH